MRRYITEKVGILEIFQIILAIVTLCLGYHSVVSDVVWNNSVDKSGLNVCIDINKAIHQKNNTLIGIAECVDHLDIKNEDICKEIVEIYYLTKLDEGHIFGLGNQFKKFFDVHMRRSQASETSFVICCNIIAVILIAHIFFSTFGSNLDLRTKWNAALQGIILFACGFSVMLLGIAYYTINYKYSVLSRLVHPCGLLRYCVIPTHPSLGVTINNVLHEFSACQEIRVKQSMCILLVIMICTCVVMIFLAMDLTTKYEQESDEQEAIEREAQENLDSLLEDQTLVFETSEDNPGAEETGATLAPPKEGFKHFKSGSTVISEYLGMTKAHS